MPGGLIALRGRDKDVIIRGGVNIYPTEIERVLLAHPAIRDTAVIGVDDAERGQAVIAVVVGEKIPAAELLADFCRQHLAPYKIPTDFRVRDELPRKASGKVDKQALLQ